MSGWIMFYYYTKLGHYFLLWRYIQNNSMQKYVIINSFFDKLELALRVSYRYQCIFAPTRSYAPNEGVHAVKCWMCSYTFFCFHFLQWIHVIQNQIQCTVNFKLIRWGIRRATRDTFNYRNWNIPQKVTWNNVFFKQRTNNLKRAVQSNRYWQTQGKWYNIMRRS